ncbi:HAMP domain-containing sensor histidine kinase [Microbacterium sp. RURRCA19A]|uniref:sensor histidine kinase n=1 Tax=Microbacterium sp. RURRCA19A TaxID=1907391 RepID=UPI000954A635|nr:HAMP domain-containing sensor histidine kinase [Microbacterium sp. RURRCA19A]SIR61497.1 His Kinase A (phospho-acceptor) domain-containing protein [Microbacterium sp. RURRCA19A]
MSAAEDRRIVRRAAARVGLLVGGASAIALAIGVGILVGVLLTGARRETDHHGGPGGLPGDRVVVDFDDVLPWVLGLGLLGVAVIGVVGWAASRWSVRPLDEALRRQRAFVSDASHELRTPLTALSSRVQIAQRRLARGEPLDDTLDRLRGDTELMDHVLTDMLLAAEGAAATEGVAAVDGGIRAAVDVLTPLADEAGVKITVRTGTGLVAAVPSVTFVRMCTALIDNAITHAPEGTAVTVSADGTDDVVAIRVEDAGGGIRDDDRERIFERFARGAESGRRRGFGLGLALVREAATRHGGTIDVERTSAEGTVFLLRLPRAR